MTDKADLTQYIELTFEDAITQCIQIFENDNSSQVIPDCMELLSEFYGCEFAYVCEFDRKSMKHVNKYFWSKSDHQTDISIEATNSEKLEEFLKWLSEDKTNPIITLEEAVYSGNEMEAYVLERYRMKNLVLHKIYHKDGSLLGLIGMNNYTKHQQEYRLIKAAALFFGGLFREVSMEKLLLAFNEIDTLTGFYNRNKYAERIVQLQENQPKTLGVLFVNINGLRRVNEDFGFSVGDVQIKKTSELLLQFFNEEFYRISGDEFVGFLVDCEKEKFEEDVDQLQKLLKESERDTKFSLGHSWGSGNYKVNELVKVADNVMLINKQAFYATSASDLAEVSNAILHDLFRGIAEDEFMVYLQPQINLDTVEVVGAEALIRRFDKRKKKMVFPDSFIPLYEQNSIIRHIDLFVVRKVCQILLEWQHFDKALPVSVNLSRVTLLEHGIVKTISDILDEYAIPHELVMIEVTERIGLVENDVASTLVDEFKANGFKLSLDDFGCAYSNIVTLAQISVDEVKIDKSLVDNILTNSKNRVIVKNMLAMCNELENMYTLAEGIETEEQAEFLRNVRCHIGQGYLYSKPIPNEEFFRKYIKQ